MANRHRNRQVFARVSGGKGSCWRVREDMSAVISSKGIHVTGRVPYVIVEQSLQRRQWVAAVVRAAGALEHAFPAADRVRDGCKRVQPDFGACQVYLDNVAVAFYNLEQQPAGIGLQAILDTHSSGDF